MIRHFLGVMFWSFIGFIVFVNLFQFSGALLPFESSGLYRQDYSDTYFGFSSLFNFATALSSNSILNNGISIFKSGFSVVKFFSVDTAIGIFDDMRNLANQNFAENIITIVSAILTFLGRGLLAPFTLLYGLTVMFLGGLLFVWSFISVFIQFLLGAYNSPLPVASSMFLSSAVSTSLV